MVLQLAWYKSQGKFTATYETALTRIYLHGRTETIRTLTTDSRAFVLAMVNSSKSVCTYLIDRRCRSSLHSLLHHQAIDRYRLLQRAIQTHVSLSREAATGRGIDRHLLGLRLMLRPDEVEQSDLFLDELFDRSQQWKLSTSGLSAGLQFRGTG